MQVLRWRITAPNGKNKYVPDNEFPLSGNDLPACYPDMVEAGQSSFSFPKVRLSWTGNKVDLVELIYALETAGCFNYGHTTIKEIVAYIEIVFNIDLGDYYHTFYEMHDRVKRTDFLDKLVKFLNERMDEADRKK
jgi:hypothetical protein